MVETFFGKPKAHFRFWTPMRYEEYRQFCRENQKPVPDLQINLTENQLVYPLWLGRSDWIKRTKKHRNAFIIQHTLQSDNVNTVELFIQFVLRKDSLIALSNTWFNDHYSYILVHIKNMCIQLAGTVPRHLSQVESWMMMKAGVSWLGDALWWVVCFSKFLLKFSCKLQVISQFWYCGWWWCSFEQLFSTHVTHVMFGEEIHKGIFWASSCWNLFDDLQCLRGWQRQAQGEGTNCQKAGGAVE